MLLLALLVVLSLSACGRTDGDDGDLDTPIDPEIPARTPGGQTIEVTDVALQQPNLDCLPAANERGFYTFDQFAQASTCVAPLFTWPPDYYPDIDARLASYGPGDRDSGWQAGLEWVSTMGQNRCAWYLTWLDARASGDSATETEALAFMQDVIYDDYVAAMPLMPKGLTHGGPDTLTKRQIDAAALGDPTLIQQEAELCRTIPWLDGPPS